MKYILLANMLFGLSMQLHPAENYRIDSKIENFNQEIKQNIKLFRDYKSIPADTIKAANEELESYLNYIFEDLEKLPKELSKNKIKNLERIQDLLVSLEILKAIFKQVFMHLDEYRSLNLWDYQTIKNAVNEIAKLNSLEELENKRKELNQKELHEQLSDELKNIIKKEEYYSKIMQYDSFIHALQYILKSALLQAFNEINELQEAPKESAQEIVEPSIPLIIETGEDPGTNK